MNFRSLGILVALVLLSQSVMAKDMLRFEEPRIRFCQEVNHSANLWLVSDHGDRGESTRKLNEHNYGLGYKLSCGDWAHVQVNKLKNSQYGYTDIVMLSVGHKWYVYDKFHVGFEIGNAYLNYRIPRLGANVEGRVGAGYIGIGYGPLTLNIAPVPKQKDVFILHVNLRF